MDHIVHGVTKSQTWLSNFHFHELMIEENSTHDRLQPLPPRYPFQTEDTWISYIPVLEVWSCNWGKAISKQPLLMCGDVGTVKWQWSWSWITWQFIWERLTQKTILQHATCMREPDPNLKIVPSLELETGRILPLSLQLLPLRRLLPLTEPQDENPDLVRHELIYCSHFKKRKLGPEGLSGLSHVTQWVACRIRDQTGTFCSSCTVCLGLTHPRFEAVLTYKRCTMWEW